MVVTRRLWPPPVTDGRLNVSGLMFLMNLTLDERLNFGDESLLKSDESERESRDL